MKRIQLTFLFTAILCNIYAQDFFIQTGGDVFLQNGAVITLQGSLQNNGSIGGTGTFLFKGSTVQSIAGIGTTNFFNLTIENNAGVGLARNIGVGNLLTLSSGLFDIKNYTVSLNPAATVTGETDITRIISTSGGGYLEITVPITASSNVTPGNLGATITPASDMGSVTVRRGHEAQTITPAGRPSINRYFEIVPSVNTSLNATLNFNYLDAELNGRNEALLSFWTSQDNTTWVSANFSNRNTASNVVQLTGIQTFPKRWTLTDQQFATGVFDLLTNNKPLKLWPNPVFNDQIISVQLSAGKRTKAAVTVMDVSGRIVLLQAVNLERGINTLQLNHQNLSAGSYTLVIRAEDGSSSQTGFIKQ